MVRALSRARVPFRYGRARRARRARARLDVREIKHLRDRARTRARWCKLSATTTAQLPPPVKGGVAREWGKLCGNLTHLQKAGNFTLAPFLWTDTFFAWCVGWIT